MSKVFSRRNLFTGVGVCSLAAAGFFFYQYSEDEKIIESAPKDMNGDPVELEISLTRDEIESMNVEVVPDLELVVDELGLKSTVALMNSVDGVVNPPDAVNTYMLSDYGTTVDKPYEGTIYLAAHSLKSGVGPGNYLFDWERDEILVEEGQGFVLGELTYVVDNVSWVGKPEISDHETIWKNDPEKLVFVTCLQKRVGRSRENLIVEAHLVTVE